MNKFDKVLTENLNLPEDVKATLKEAWDEQLSEAKEDLGAEMRQEFAQKYSHDKGTIVEAMGSFITERLTAELTEFAEDKRALVQERADFKKSLKVLEQFLVKGLAKEIQELREDRIKAEKGFSQLEGFVIEQLSEEIQSLHADKTALVEQRVTMVREGKRTIAEAKKSLITKSAKLLESRINTMLTSEIMNYREDIEKARQNDFGRRVFEAFGGEFMGSFLNENTEVKELQGKLSVMESTVAKLNETVAEKTKLVESRDAKLKLTNGKIQRNKVMTGLMQTLSEDKKAVMKGLLGTVETANLESEFRKYLPVVLSESGVEQAGQSLSAQVLTESKSTKAGTGAVAQTNSNEPSLAALQILAGITQK